MTTSSQSSSTEQALEAEVLELLRKAVLAGVPLHEGGKGGNKTLLLIRRSDVSFRTIINLKTLSQFFKVRPFKMKLTRSAIKLIFENRFIVRILEIQYHVPVLVEHQRFLRVVVVIEGTIRHFQFRALPFGLAIALPVFTKVVAEVMAYLHETNALIIPYLDDFLIVGIMLALFQTERRQDSGGHQMEYGTQSLEESLLSCRRWVPSAHEALTLHMEAGKSSSRTVHDRSELGEIANKQDRQVNSSNLKGETNENLIQLFRITQSLMKIKSQEVEFVLEEAGKAAEEQAKTASLISITVSWIEGSTSNLLVECDLEWERELDNVGDCQQLCLGRETMHQVLISVRFKATSHAQRSRETPSITDKIRLHRSRGKKTRRRHHMKMGGVVPDRDTHRTRTEPGPPLGYIGGLSTALQNALQNAMAQLSTGTRDSRFLREEIRQLEEQLGQKERELKDTRKELEKEKQVNERLALRNEEADNENSKLRRENEQLRQDVIDYQRQLASQRETLLTRGEGQDYKTVLSKKNMELVQYLDEIQSLSEANERLESQNLEMTKNLEESVQEMEKMTDEYSKMKLMVQHSDSVMDQLRKEKDHYKLQVTELTDQLKAKNEEDDPVMVAVNLKVEEWKGILASKDEAMLEYQQMVHNLREKLKVAELDAEKSSVLALQQGLQERDNHIKLLTEQLEQHTKDMESHSLHIEDLKRQLQAEKGDSSYAQHNRAERLEAVVQLTEQRLREAERIAELAEDDARQKDKDLIDAVRRMKEYETGIYGLEEAVAEIKELKTHLKIRDHEIETLTTDINKLELKINDILDENEDLRERLGCTAPKPQNHT
ncbi:unnamed protein product [Ranitomeya imitator]|uniref:Uncharacterized protein n=1 Tax=Ranitomeya imitator TaxID=111125 RepID=A0ABN9KT73_9NEOB|nr:unnamed protein product [Ranitomeya imitator]